MADESSTPVRLSDDDIAFLLMVLRNSSRPLSTAQLVEALREQSLRN
jgi:GAF domain-containing protein